MSLGLNESIGKCLILSLTFSSATSLITLCHSWYPLAGRVLMVENILGPNRHQTIGDDHATSILTTFLHYSYHTIIMIYCDLIDAKMFFSKHICLYNPLRELNVFTQASSCLAYMLRKYISGHRWELFSIWDMNWKLLCGWYIFWAFHILYNRMRFYHMEQDVLVWFILWLTLARLSPDIGTCTVSAKLFQRVLQGNHAD